MSQAKQERQRLIADWLRRHRIASQEALVERLEKAGVAATQATVSRDLEELGAVRVRGESGMAYRLPDQPQSPSGQLDRLLADWVIDIIPAGNLVVLRTPPGSANLVANAIDAAGLADVAGTIAGDDTIFLALADGRAAAKVADGLRQRREGR